MFACWQLFENVAGVQSFEWNRHRLLIACVTDYVVRDKQLCVCVSVDVF